MLAFGVKQQEDVAEIWKPRNKRSQVLGLMGQHAHMTLRLSHAPQDIDPLAGFEKLTLLSLVGNPVVAKQNYR